jgi:hypothetical protein
MTAIFRRASLVAVTLASLLPCTRALAQEELPQSADQPPGPPEPPPFHRGLQLGARLGYSVPVGSVTPGSGGTQISNLETASVPIGVDFGVRVSPVTYLGATVSWGPGLSPNNSGACSLSNVHCSEHDAQARLEARFYLRPHANPTGWLALGAGWEVATFNQSIAGGYAVTSTYTGPIFPDMQLGVDWRSGDILFGPYVGATISTFMTAGQDPTTSSVPTMVPSPSQHAWLTIGFHGTYGPF